MMCSDTENNLSYSQFIQKTAVVFLQDNKVDPARILLRIAACLETNSITVGQNYVNSLVNHDMKSPLIFEKISRRQIQNGIAIDDCPVEQRSTIQYLF